jgi:hypothetical protein
LQGGDVFCLLSDPRDAVFVIRSGAQAFLCSSRSNGSHTSKDFDAIQITWNMNPLITVENSMDSQTMNQEGLA